MFDECRNNRINTLPQKSDADLEVAPIPHESPRSILEWIEYDSKCKLVPTGKLQLDYPDPDENVVDEILEVNTNIAENKHGTSFDMSSFLAYGEDPLFHYFLDGSRRTYKVAELSHHEQYYPIFAGQIGVGCCSRDSREMRKFDYWGRLVLSLPDFVKKEEWTDQTTLYLSHINSDPKLKRLGLKFETLLYYNRQAGDNPQNLAIARIQNYMSELEQKMVADMATRSDVDQRHFLLKDGSLQYFSREKQGSDENELVRSKKQLSFCNWRFKIV